MTINLRVARLAAAMAAIGIASMPLVASSFVLRTGSFFFLMIVTLAGLHIVTGLARIVSLCHAALMGVGAYASALLSLRLGLPPAATIVVAALLAALISYGLAVLTRRLEDHYLALATLAAAEVLVNIMRSATALTGGVNGITGVPPLALPWLTLASPRDYFLLCAAMGLAALWLAASFDAGLTGRMLRAVGDEGRLVDALGVDSSKIRATGFALGGGMAGVAGALGAHIDGFVGPESYGPGLAIAYLCFLTIGGLGRLRGVVIGAAIASVGTEALRTLAEWQMVITAIVALWLLVGARGFSRTHQRQQVL